jgi:hypothetical protein
LIALGGTEPTMQWMTATIHALAPLSEKLSVWGGLQYAAARALLALTNGGNELMIFGQAVSGLWGSVKVWLFVAIGLTAICLLVTPKRLLPLKRTAALLLVLLPCSYVLVGSVLGTRLWVHHFSVLVPLAYLIVAVVAAHIIQQEPRHAATAVALICAIVFSLGNIHQGNNFYRRLTETGGVGKASNALTTVPSTRSPNGAFSCHLHY